MRRKWKEDNWWGRENIRYEEHINNGSSIAIWKISSVLEVKEDNIGIIQANKAIWEDRRRRKERKVKKIRIWAK